MRERVYFDVSLCTCVCLSVCVCCVPVCVCFLNQPKNVVSSREENWRSGGINCTVLQIQLKPQVMTEKKKSVCEQEERERGREGG